MPTRCAVCGKLMDSGEAICEICQENIRAEAMGRHKKIAKDAFKETKKLRVSKKRGALQGASAGPFHEDEAEKKPHHFKSMAEYLDYLKRKE
jgi:hypothetical protein